MPKKFKIKTIGRQSGVVSEYITTVDDEDAHLLRSSYWAMQNSSSEDQFGNKTKRKYVVRRGRNGTEFLHHVITGASAGEKVFHINGEGLDNRRCNLMKQSSRIEEVE